MTFSIEADVVSFYDRVDEGIPSSEYCVSEFCELIILVSAEFPCIPDELIEFVVIEDD